MSVGVPLSREAVATALARCVTHPRWRSRLLELANVDAPAALHLAVTHEPFLSLLLAGRKTVESRFSVNRVCPFESVAAGDVLALKAQSGPIVGLALVEHTAFYELDPPTWEQLRSRFSGELCAKGDAFWQERAHTRFGSLLRVTEPLCTQPLSVNKRDRRGWVRLASHDMQQSLAL